MHDIEFLFSLLAFGAIFSFCIYLFGAVVWGVITDQEQRRDAWKEISDKPWDFLFSLACGIFMIWLSGSLLFSMFGFDTGFR